MSRFYHEGDYDRSLELVFGLNLHSYHLQMAKLYPHSKEGQYTYTNQLTNIETIILWFFGEALQFEATMAQLHTFHIDFHHQHMSI